ncbi:MAG TPA: DoxX family protein [Puia sp.]|nr:DoxX family protein [Puia sp.]
MPLLFWILRILAAVILLQTLFFKFSGAEESIYIFSTLGMEPWGRIGTGVVELIASVLILIPRTTAFGAVLAVGTMSGALFFHLTRLGIEVRGDHGQLFIYALLVFISSGILAWTFRKQLCVL